MPPITAKYPIAFSIKQLLFCMAVVAFALVAINVDKPILGKLFDLLTLGILIATAYGAWLSHGEQRAFRVGFLCWAVLYFILFKKKFDVGVDVLFGLVYRAIQPPISAPPTQFAYRFLNFTPVSHCLTLLLLGVVGGWVTVHFYCKRQRMNESRE